MDLTLHHSDLVQVSSAIELPKLYQIVQCRNALSKPVLEEISSTPGHHHPGSQRSLAKCLQREAQTSGNSCLRVSVSVDGARISRKSNFVVMSYAMLDSENALAASGNKVVGIVNAPETYNTLEESFSVLLTEVNDIAKAGHVIVDDTEVKVELFLGGDMKFLLMVLGLSSATATHACPWCKVHKSYRHQTTYSRNYWNEPPHGRSIVELVTQKHVQVKDTCVSYGKPAASKYGQKQKPLVHIAIDHIVIDELHLMLRITDILTSAIIKDAIRKDKLDGEKKVLEGKNLKGLIAANRHGSVTFTVWESRNADGGGSGQFEFTSFMGPDKLRLLRALPSQVSGCLTNATEGDVVELWEMFYAIYKKVASTEVGDIDTLEEEIKSWVVKFCNLGNHLPGYEKAKVTPYIHCLMCHIPHMMCRFGNIRQFSGHGVEKLNDVARQIHHRRSNKHNPTEDVFLATGRLEELDRRGRERRKRTNMRKCTADSSEPAA